MINIFEDSCTEEVTGVGKATFEGAFKFAAYEARKNFDSTDLAVQREEYRYASPYTQEPQNLEGKLEQRDSYPV